MSKQTSKLHGFTNTRDYLFHGLVAILGDDGFALKDGLIASVPQRDYAQRWAETIARTDERQAMTMALNPAPAGLMLASADTGTGKTIGYGVPLLLRAAQGRKVVISTLTHALQKQLIGTPKAPGDILKIVGWIKKLGYGELTVARRVGLQAFISLSALEMVFNQLQKSSSDLNTLNLDAEWDGFTQLLAFAKDANQGLTSGLIEDIREQLGGELPLNITMSSICLGADSDSADRYAYEEHLKIAQQADVVIVSHAHLAVSAMYRKAELMNEPVDTLVVDEADHLSGVAASMFSSDVSLRRVGAGFSLLDGPVAKAATAAIEQLTKFIERLYVRNNTVIASELLSHQKEELFALTEVAANYAGALAQSLKTHPQNLSRDSVEEIARQSQVIKQFLNGLNLSNTSDAALDVSASELCVSAISFSPVHSLPSLMVMPVNAGMVMSRFWNGKKVLLPFERSSVVSNVLLTSATLGAPGHYATPVERFAFFACELGISLSPINYQASQFDLWSYFEPASFGKVRFILADPGVTNPVMGTDDDQRAILDPEWVAYCVAMICAARQAGGRTLVLVNSYRDVESIEQALGDSCESLIAQVKGQSTRDCQERFLNAANSVWLSPTAWEGLNLPGAISNLVIARLPFSPPNDSLAALLRAKAEYSRSSIQAILAARSMSQLKRKLRQGMFRGIRSISDKSRIWVADPRFPIDNQSEIPLRHPAQLSYASVKRYPALHVVIPYRFKESFKKGQILLKSGQFLG